MDRYQLPSHVYDTRAALLAPIIVVVLACSAIGSCLGIVGCCDSRPENKAGVVDGADLRNYHAELELCNDAINGVGDHESSLIEAENSGYERCMYSETKLRDIGARKWPQVLSIYGHRLIDDPGQPSRYKVDIHATQDALIPLPPLGDDLRPRFDADRSEYIKRAVTEFDLIVASRDLPVGTMVKLCQNGRCSDPVIVGDYGPNGALCDDPADCQNRYCQRRTTDISRPGWVGEAYWTVLRFLGPSCSFRGAADITWAVCHMFDCVPMRPVTVTRV